ncbi:T9SS type A sorting domain-containing protein [Hymenobacter algoricola]|uniref:Secretion system C-terminal sorting domain-containing protein n=1 Tax=Hymenobacter algoricola TaxID=486267 RepID=A0ABP7N0L3_9BACT
MSNRYAAAARRKASWAGLLLTVLLAGPARATTTALSTALAPDGTLRAGVSGSFDARGYTLQTAPDGRPVFRPAGAARFSGTLGTGDEFWSNAFQNNGPNGPLRALAVDGNGNVYAGGSFTTAGGVAANNIARWNGTSWSALGSGTNAYVYALVLDGAGNLYAGGRFSEAGGLSVFGTAKWNGTSWSALGGGMNGWVFALALDAAGNLYAGGNFNRSDGLDTNGVAKWNGTSWAALGAGVGGPGPFNTVFALTLDGSGNLYAGGIFTTAGGVPASNVAKWNGTNWAALGAGVDGSGLNALAADGAGTVYAAGYFTRAGGVVANNIARWNGTAWSAMGTGIGASNPTNTVRTVAVSGAGTVYAGGDFVTAGGVATRNVARWNGTSWSGLGTGVNAFVAALLPAPTGLYTGGDFTATGDASKSMVRVGFYSSTVLAAAAAQPALALSLYPNPAHAAATVRLPALPGTSQATLQLVDALGRVVRTEQVRLAAGGTSAELSLAGVAPGLYRLWVQAGSRRVSQALAVE